MEVYYLLTEQELFDLSSRKKSIAGLKLEHLIYRGKRVFFSKESESKLALFALVTR